MLSSSISSNSRPPLFPMLRKKLTAVITKILTYFHYFKPALFVTNYSATEQQWFIQNELCAIKKGRIECHKKLEVGVDKQKFKQIDSQVYRQNGINGIMDKDENQRELKKRQTEFTAQLQTAIRHWQNQLLEKLKKWKNSLDSVKHRGFLQNFTAYELMMT